MGVFINIKRHYEFQNIAVFLCFVVIPARVQSPVQSSAVVSGEEVIS